MATRRPHLAPLDPNAPGALPYLAAAGALLTRDPEGAEVMIVNALREAPGAAELWSRWLPNAPGSSSKAFRITLRLNLITPAAREHVDKVHAELTMRLSAHHVTLELVIASLAVAAPDGAPSLIWSAVHDAAWMERQRALAWTAGKKASY